MTTKRPRRYIVQTRNRNDCWQTVQLYNERTDAIYHANTLPGSRVLVMLPDAVADARIPRLTAVLGYF